MFKADAQVTIGASFSKAEGQALDSTSNLGVQVVFSRRIRVAPVLAGHV